MKTTLPTLSEIVDNTANMAYDGNFITNHIWDYNDFLKQSLKLWMFIPCKNGEPLEEPKNPIWSDLDQEDTVYYEKLHKEYQQAKDRVIFKGFELIQNKDGRIDLGYNGFAIVFIKAKGKWKCVYEQSISDLCNKVELTDKEYERLNLKI